MVAAGSALLAKARSARVLNGMAEDEAARAGIEKRRSFFRVDNGKANLSPAGEKADWYRLLGVEIGNGDNVVAVAPWKWPNPLAGITPDDLRAVQAKIREGRYRESIQSQDWAGNAVASVLKLNLSKKADKAKAAGLLKTWLAKDMLRVVEGLDAKSMPRKFVEVGHAGQRLEYIPPLFSTPHFHGLSFPHAATLASKASMATSMRSADRSTSPASPASWPTSPARRAWRGPTPRRRCPLPS